MNIIINGFMDQRTVPIVKKVLAELKVDNFVYTRYYYKPDFGRFNSKATLINWRKITFFGDYDTDLNQLEPLDEEIVDSMRECEAVVLKMMDRIETYKSYSYHERRDLYLKHLRYWNNLMTRKKIDLFLTSNVPHETSDFVCYSLCKLKKIPTIILFQTHIPDTCFICDDWETSNYGLPAEYKKLKTKYSKKVMEQIPLTPRFQKYFRLQTHPDTDVAPFYMDQPTILSAATKRTVSVYRKLISDPSFFRREGKTIFMAVSRRFVLNIRTKILMRYYEKNSAKFNPKEKYFFVALHLQPEMSTSPRADAYVDQLMMVRLLSACAPKGVKIYVKEHPNQISLGRNKAYYNSLLALSNVRLMSRKTDSRELIKNSGAVATCVGLAGFEGLFHNKPLLMFGHDFFQYAPGVFPIRTKADLKSAIKKISAGPVFTLKDFKIFVKAMENVSVHGTIDTDYMPTSTLPHSKNTDHIAEAILKQIERFHV